MKEVLERAIIKLMKKSKFLGYLFVSLPYEFSSDIPTAAITNEGRIKINPDFLVKLGDNSHHLLAHELLHLVLEHFKRDKSRGPEERYLWNLATDLSIDSLILHKFGFEPGVYEETTPWKKDPNFPKLLSAEEYFRILKGENSRENQKGTGGGEGGEGGEGGGKEQGGGGRSKEERNEQVEGREGKNRKENQREGGGGGKNREEEQREGGGGGKNREENQREGEGGKNREEQRYEGRGDIHPDEIEEDRVRMIEDKIRMALEMSRGDEVGEFVERLLLERERNVKIENKILTFLRRRAEIRRKFTPPSKKTYVLGGKVIFPKEKGRKFRMILVIDSSGSMGRDELSYALGVINKFLKSLDDYEVKVFQNDTKIRKEEIYKKPRVLPSEYEILGRGGTSFVQVFDRIEKERNFGFDVVVVISDLEAEYPDRFSHPEKVLWIGTKRTISPPWGVVVRM